ncbi:hypothetical protein [Streptococcus loxodontisalivarius]|uniref:Uncharacterized protein n=1 Tax=Streptococcus loxodontisalivarius TaxID=1349415 RepID=A0ABS2PQ16_9STRE|nr:hypothetical protein [Streptococcus loxodontisalivarius]MBM7642132.1 hypothetical protein [Streptococcus loxodontisalivarius]
MTIKKKLTLLALPLVALSALAFFSHDAEAATISSSSSQTKFSSIVSSDLQSTNTGYEQLIKIRRWGRK